MKIKIVKFTVLFLCIFIFNSGIVYSQLRVGAILVKPDSINLTAPEFDPYRIYKSNTIIHPDTMTPQGNVVAGDTIKFIIVLSDTSFSYMNFTPENLDSVITHQKRNGMFLSPYVDSVFMSSFESMVSVGTFPYRTDPAPGLTDTVWFVFKDTSGISFSGLSKIFTTVGEPIYISIPEILALQGETFNIPINLEGGYSVDDNVLSFECGVQFDTTVLTANGASLTSLTSNFSIESSIIYDTVYVSCARHSPLSGTGELVYLNFTVKDTVSYGNYSILHITKSILNEGEPYSISRDGKVDINPLFGDADRNGVIEALDATKMLKYCANLAVIDSLDSIHCDVSGNSAVTAYDAGLVLKWLVTPPDLKGFLVEYKPTYEPDLLNLDAEIIVYSESDLDEIDSYKIVSVDLRNIDKVFSLGMILNYDSEFFEFVDYRIPDLTKKFNTIVNDIPGKIFVAMAGSKPIKRDGKVIEFTFRKNIKGNGKYYFTGFMINERQMNNKIEYISTLLNYLLYQNYPNPFNLETEIKFIIPEACDVFLKIYNLLGEEVRILINERREKGFYTIKWDGKDSRGLTVSSGIYFYRLQAGSFVSTKKMVLVK